jgi:CrcB protein
MTVWLCLGVALAGAVGAGTRFVLDGVVRARRRSDSRWSDLPFGTPFINVTGSLVLGLLAGLVLFHGIPSAWQVIAGTGFCGGYTTFSTASFETIRLIQDRRTTFAAINAVGTLALSLVAAGAGLALAAR